MFFVAAVLAILSGLFYAASLRRAVMRSARWVSRCANTAVRSATIHCLCWWLQDWLRAGAHSSACALRSLRISVMMPSCR
jgi:hypothetical protein